jgi:UDP-2,3-diacylglucosamine pyrophosphatase LpxH
MTTTTGYKCIVLSDLHLGMNDCKPKRILNFLDTIKTDLLILNGDIIDIDAMRRGSKWKDKHMKVLIKLLDISRNTEVIYIRGNHDDEVKDLYSSMLGNIKFMDEYIYESNNKKYIVFHGDKIDVTTKYKLLTQIGSIGYDVALRINTWYNKYREWTNQPYYSISKVIKENFKKALSFINDFEENACNYAKTIHCNGVICGHIHIPSIKVIDDIEYYNSGDWVENFTALVLTSEDEWELIQMT